MVPEEGVEPTQSKAPADFESAASASSATPGMEPNLLNRSILRPRCLFGVVSVVVTLNFFNRKTRGEN